MASTSTSRWQRREESLSPYAIRSDRSHGRERPEPDDALRNPFQIDRDRIIRSKAFRRLMHKTQVFLAPQGDHYLTRLTHTMEVSLIARGIARALNLNEDLTEAICMGHDLGHAPFGHLGEATLTEVHGGGFRHNKQSVRVVELLENDGHGLNLTYEVRQGILRHSKGRGGIEGQANPELDTLEGLCAKLADALAYITHDTDDAVRAGVLAAPDLPSQVTSILGSDRSQWARLLAEDIVRTSWSASGEVTIPAGQHPSIRMSSEVSAAANALRDFLFEHVYEPASRGEQADRAREIIALLYRFFAQHPERVPEGYTVHTDEPGRMALDYVSGMTDGYALRVAEQLKPGIAKGFREGGVPLYLPV
ncbi:MAG: deoxyguanosinetriphosphate triphosphohydrolase [Chloroflexi bacterium]|nr:deoxyguanosinetriphosphate triphosphohydrolase [Chloroflexota bacterium]